MMGPFSLKHMYKTQDGGTACYGFVDEEVAFIDILVESEVSEETLIYQYCYLAPTIFGIGKLLSKIKKIYNGTISELIEEDRYKNSVLVPLPIDLVLSSQIHDENALNFKALVKYTDKYRLAYFYLYNRSGLKQALYFVMSFLSMYSFALVYKYYSFDQIPLTVLTAVLTLFFIWNFVNTD